MNLSPQRGFHLIAMLVASGALACTTAAEPAPPLYSMELTERYGDEGDRNVSVRLNLSQGIGDSLAVDQAKLTLEPAADHSLAKLESQLNELMLRRDGASAWRVPMTRPVPETLPVMRRVQFALAVLHEGDHVIERATVQVFSAPASIGFMRLETSGERVEISSIAVTTAQSLPRLAMASAHGTRDITPGNHTDGFTLEGKRWILGQSVESMKMVGAVKAASHGGSIEETAHER